MEKVENLNNFNCLVQARNGLFIANRYDFYLGHALIRYGEYGEIEWNLLNQFLDSDSTVVEVGANIGTHTVSIARAVGNGGRVIAIEPQRVIYQYLCANLALNGLMNVETHRCGCGRESGTLVVPAVDYTAEKQQNFGGVSLQENGPGETTRMCRLDDLVGDNRRVRLIKIDVEGMEADVIMGATATIRASRPILYVENDRVEKSEELIRLLSGLEYRLYWHIPPLFNPDNFFGEKENIYENLASCNMLCLPNEATARVQGLQEIVDPVQHPLLPPGQPHRDLAEIARQHHNAGRFSEAEAVYQNILAIDPDSAEIYKDHGDTLFSLERLEEAEQAYRRALSLKPGYAEAHNNLGNVLARMHRMEESEHAYLRALAIKPDYAAAYYNLGNVLCRAGRLEEAEQAFYKSLVLMPGSAEAHNNYGNVLMEFDRIEEAEQSFRKALVLKPDFAIALYNRGNALMALGREQLAEKSYRRAIVLDPDYVAAYSGLGNVLALTGRRDEAENAYLKALALKPDHATLQYNLSHLYLLQGRFEEGLNLHEQRFKGGSRRAFGRINAHLKDLPGRKRWEGGPLEGKSLLIVTEQGAGDSLMMMRYLPLLKERGLKRLLVYGEPALTRLFQSMAVVDEVISMTEPLPIDRMDFYCPIMSLPYLFQTRLESVPANVPYLSATDIERKIWRTRLESASGIKVGLAWAGNSQHAHNNRRSIPLSKFSPLKAIEGVQLVSLQKGEEADQLKDLGWRFPDWMDTCDDYQDTAGLVAELDLVISVDTSVAHLAGALGKPVWLLNRFESEWRWLLEREDSPWYPGMKIFRQKESGDWDSVIIQVAEELRNR